MTTTARKPSATLTETMYGVERTYTATRMDRGTSRRGAAYAIRVDGVTVEVAHYLGGRRYQVVAPDGSKAWEFVTASDGGKVADVMEYVARASTSTSSDRAGVTASMRRIDALGHVTERAAHDGQTFDTREAAERATFEAGGTAYMVYEDRREG